MALYKIQCVRIISCERVFSFYGKHFVTLTDVNKQKPLHPQRDTVCVNYVQELYLCVFVAKNTENGIRYRQIITDFFSAELNNMLMRFDSPGLFSSPEI